MRKVEVWEDSRGNFHRSETACMRTERDIERHDAANQLLDAGHTVFDCIVALYGPDVARADLEERYSVLKRVTKDTKLIISHLQCSDLPGYQVRSILPNSMVYVFGDAGSWSGPYGSHITFDALATYVEGTENALAKAKKKEG